MDPLVKFGNDIVKCINGSDLHPVIKSGILVDLLFQLLLERALTNRGVQESNPRSQEEGNGRGTEIQTLL